jgi:hypothetical protein
VAADISSQYLVWKNPDGSIGIGDSQYPERDRLEVASTGGWSVMKEEPLAEKSPEPASPRKVEKKALDEKLLEAGVGGQYLMWKDKNGQIGFGNVEYPELVNMAYVHTGGSWQKWQIIKRLTILLNFFVMPDLIPANPGFSTCIQRQMDSGLRRYDAVKYYEAVKIKKQRCFSARKNMFNRIKIPAALR